MVDPAHPPSRRAPLRWAVGGVVPWLLLGVGQLVWVRFDQRLPWLHIVIAVGTVAAVGTAVRAHHPPEAQVEAEPAQGPQPGRQPVHLGVPVQGLLADAAWCPQLGVEAAGEISRAAPASPC